MPRTANRAWVQHSVHDAAGHGTSAATVTRASGVA